MERTFHLFGIRGKLYIILRIKFLHFFVQAFEVIIKRFFQPHMHYIATSAAPTNLDRLHLRRINKSEPIQYTCHRTMFGYILTYSVIVPLHGTHKFFVDQYFPFGCRCFSRFQPHPYKIKELPVKESQARRKNHIATIVIHRIRRRKSQHSGFCRSSPFHVWQVMKQTECVVHMLIRIINRRQPFHIVA